MRGTRIRVAVAGLGLIGGSLARTAARTPADVSVVGYDPDPSTRAAARGVGVETVDTVAALCGTRPDVVVLAVPLVAMSQVAAEVAASAGLPAHTVVTDVGSVKAPVRAAVEAAGLGDRYVGAHPMAGTELSGFAASSADLVVGAPWAVTVGPRTAAEPLLVVLDLVRSVWRGRPRVVTDEAHDDAVALVSHVPHVLATELLNAVADAPVRELALGLAAGSFRDGTRVARTDPRRTQAMVAGNATAVARALRVAARELSAVADALEPGIDVGTESATALDGFFGAADDLRAGAVGRTAELAARPDDRRIASVTVDLAASSWRTDLTDLGAAGAVVANLDTRTRTITLDAPAA